MSKARLIADSFELRKRNRICNMRGCGKLPTKRITLYDENRISREKKSIATIYLCSEHNETRMPAFMTEINTKKEVGKVVSKRVSDLGFLTY
jgi:hypothetical protein